MELDKTWKSDHWECISSKGDPHPKGELCVWPVGGCEDVPPSARVNMPAKKGACRMSIARLRCRNPSSTYSCNIRASILVRISPHAHARYLPNANMENETLSPTAFWGPGFAQCLGSRVQMYSQNI